MIAEIKVGRTDGKITSYNLFFSNGLRLKADTPWFMSADERAEILAQFLCVVDAMRAAGFVVTGEI